MAWYPSEWDNIILENHQRMFLSFGYYLSIKKTHRSLVARPQKNGIYFQVEYVGEGLWYTVNSQ